LRLKRAFVASLALVATLIWTGGCDPTDDIITSTGTLRVSVVDRDLTSQFEAFTDPSNPPGWQVMAWEIQSADLAIPVVDPGTFSYVLTTTLPCIHRQLAPRTVLPLDCGLVPGFFGEGVGYSMDPAVPLEVSMVLEIERMDIRRADRPLLLPNLDHDGDLVINDEDNCVLIPNPDQVDSNGDGFGDACSLPNFNGDLTIPDRDGDTIPDDGDGSGRLGDNPCRDGITENCDDNCLWIPNTDQEDETPEGAIPLLGEGEASPPDGIGDACESWAPIGPMPLRLELPVIVVSIEGSAQNSVSADFNNQTAVSCDPGFTSCFLDPGAVLFTSP
jgi:hypothetical protein